MILDLMNEDQYLEKLVNSHFTILEVVQLINGQFTTLAPTTEKIIRLTWHHPVEMYLLDK